MMTMDTDGGVDFAFGDESEHLPRHYYFNTTGFYSELVYGFHVERDVCCESCIRWLQAPSDMATDIDVQGDWNIAPARPIVYATIDGNGTLNVVKEIGPDLSGGQPPNGYRISPGADLDLAAYYKTHPLKPSPIGENDWRDDLQGK